MKAKYVGLLALSFALGMMVSAVFLWPKAEASRPEPATVGFDLASITGNKNYDGLPVLKLGADASAEEKLLKKFFTTTTLAEYRSTFPAGYLPSMTEAGFSAWRENREKMQLSLVSQYPYVMNGEQHVVFVYQFATNNGQLAFGNFAARKTGQEWRSLTEQEYTAQAPLHIFFSRITPGAWEFLRTEKSPRKCFEHSDLDEHVADLAKNFRSGVLNGKVINGRVFLTEVEKMASSTDESDAVLASMLVRAPGLGLGERAIVKVTDANMEEHKALAKVASELHLNADQTKVVVRHAVNKKYLAAAYALNNFSPDTDLSMDVCVRKVTELYGPVITIVGGPQANVRK